MKANLLNDDLSIKNKWLKNPYNNTILKYVEDYNYFFVNLEEYNNELSYYLKTEKELAYIFYNIRIIETTTGLIIEELFHDLRKNPYGLRYYSFLGEDRVKIL